MVKLLSALPKGELDGLSSIEGVLSTDSSTRLAIVALRTKGVDYDKETGEIVVRVRILQIEPVTAEAAEKVGPILQSLYEQRTGATKLDMPDDDPVEDEPEAPRVLELEEGSGYSFRVKDLPAGRFGLYLSTRYVDEAGRRGNLLRSEHGEVAPGEYSYTDLPQSLRPIADVLVTEWEKNTGSDAVDAEVVDDEAEPFEGDDFGDPEEGA